MSELKFISHVQREPYELPREDMVYRLFHVTAEYGVFMTFVTAVNYCTLRFTRGQSLLTVYNVPQS